MYWVSTVNMTFKDNTGYSYAWGDFDALWWTNIDGSGQGKLEFNEDQIIPDNFFQYAFSRDGKDVAWIPQKEEPNCYWRDFVSGRIGEGIYTKYAKAVIDWPYVDDFVHRCFIMYVASLSNIDNPTKVVLMPPTSLLAGDFTFGESYRLTWWPDGSKILLFNDGTNDWDYSDFPKGHVQTPVLYSVTLSSVNPTLNRLKTFPADISNEISLGSFSPDGRQIIVANNFKEINILNLETGNYVHEFGSNITPDSQVQRVRNIYWLP